MINPYYCYALSFGVALILYPLNWSNLYPKLSPFLIAFLITTIVVMIFVGKKYFSKRIDIFSIQERWSSRIHAITTLTIYLLWVAEFLHAGGIPLIKILTREKYDYRIFGIPTFHVLVVTFSSFYTLYLFHLYLSVRKKIYILLWCVNLSAALLIYNRGMLIFNLCGSFILLTSLINNRKVFYLLPVIALVGSFVFGVLGTLRVSRENGGNYDNDYFLDIGKATDQFRYSFIPKEFFWTYIYTTSPVANLQHNIDTAQPEINFVSTGKFITNELLLDFISKRINTTFNVTPIYENRIQGPFNATSVYSRAYSYCGWPGILTMALFIVALPIVYLKILTQQSPFYLTGFAILCTVYLFLAFENTIRFTGLSFQLVYPVLFTFLLQKFEKK